MQYGDGIDHVIKTVIEAARQMLQDNKRMEENDIGTESEFVDKRSSARTSEDDRCSKNEGVVNDASGKTDWYEIALREGITVTTRSDGDTQARSFGSCEVTVDDTAIQKSNASGAM